MIIQQMILPDQSEILSITRITDNHVGEKPAALASLPAGVANAPSSHPSTRPRAREGETHARQPWGARVDAYRCEQWGRRGAGPIAAVDARSGRRDYFSQIFSFQ
jgi:hypothetical protein